MRELLDNVSKFWSKYFKDVDILHSLHEGALSKIAEFKQDSAAYLVSTGLDSIPTKIRRDFKLLELKDSNFRILNPSTVSAIDGRFLVYFLGETEIRSIPFITNSPNGDTYLENGVDYELFRGDSEAYARVFEAYSLEPSHYFIIFNVDPRLDTSFRKEKELAIGLYKVTIEEDNSSFDVFEELQVDNPSGETLGRVNVVLYEPSTKELYLHVSTPLTSFEGADTLTDSNFNSYTILHVDEFAHINNSLQCWAPNSYIDPGIMRDRYSHLHKTSFYGSSEEYRTFLTGLSLLKSSEFSSKNVKAAVCLCSGIPVFFTSYEGGDRIIHVEKSTDFTTIHTTLAKYVLPSQLTIRPEILADAIDISTEGVSDAGYPKPLTHTQTFIFSELDMLISDDELCIKSDKLSDNSWWDRDLTSLKFLEVPEEVMLNEPLVRRLVINHDYPNLVGEVIESRNGNDYKLPPAAIGDYGIAIGQATRNTVAYRLFKDFIKSHFLYIQLSANFLQHTELNNKPTILEDLRDLIQSSSLPGSLVLLGPSLDANIDDLDSDGIPDLIDPYVS